MVVQRFLSRLNQSEKKTCHGYHNYFACMFVIQCLISVHTRKLENVSVELSAYD